MTEKGRLVQNKTAILLAGIQNPVLYRPSVIAHEYVHFSGKHGRDRVRFYRAQNVWMKVRDELKTAGKYNFFMKGFLHKYLPALYSLKMLFSRQNEMEKFFLHDADDKIWDIILERMKSVRSLPSDTHPSELERIEAVERRIKRDAGCDKFEENTAFQFHKARLMLEDDNNEGEERLLQVIEKDAQFIPTCCFMLMNRYLYKRDIDKAAEYYNYAVGFMITNDDVKTERGGTIKFNETVLPHDFSPQTIAKMLQRLKQYQEIKRIYTAR